jgi:hypothetical protein
MLEENRGELSVIGTQLDEEKLATLRRWGEGLRELGSEELAAAGRAILLLLEEIDRLHTELWHQSQSPSTGKDEAASNNTSLSTTLRDRLRWRLGRANDPLSAALPQPVETTRRRLRKPLRADLLTGHNGSGRIGEGGDRARQQKGPISEPVRRTNSIFMPASYS